MLDFSKLATEPFGHTDECPYNPDNKPGPPGPRVKDGEDERCEKCGRIVSLTLGTL
jgi:hypothetical protein